MAELSVRAQLHNGESASLTVPLGAGETHVTLPLRGMLQEVTARLPLSLEAGEKIFMNGFQSWTACPEYGAKDSIRSLRHLPRAAIERFGIDRYGDYYFVDYPERPGVTHGVSYCYFRLGERFRLLSSLDETAGYTLFQYDANAGELRARRDCEGLCVDGDFPAFDLFYAEGGEDEVFDAWFAAMGVRCRTAEKLAGYSSWYDRYENISERTIRDDLAGCASVLRPGDLFQIDDGWEPSVGDWLETDPKKFPNGLKPLADEIHAHGLRAGLWLAPFAASRRSRLFSEHPDWLYRRDGRPWYAGMTWGGFFALDFDHPEVRAYLKKVFSRVFDEWGFDLVKLDFLYAAAPFGSACETRAGRMRRAMALLRELCGDKLILGCGVPLMPAFGLVEYCRVGCDMTLDWDNNLVMRHTNRERPSTRLSLANTVFRRELNGRAFLSDPDVFFLREKNLRLTEEQKLTVATANALFGGIYLCSDNMGRYGKKKKELYRRLLDLHGAEHIRVAADTPGLVSVTYEVGGIHKLLKIKNL
ncbi:MAG: alpha-galactosidase [Oscillospiraceae bacterium]|nr:alpha-galactosidase [Oscillospiraceae bacterium]